MPSANCVGGFGAGVGAAVEVQVVLECGGRTSLKAASGAVMVARWKVLGEVCVVVVVVLGVVVVLVVRIVLLYSHQARRILLRFYHSTRFTYVSL